MCICIHALENVGRNQGSEELALVLRHKHVDLQSSLHVSAYLKAYDTHALKEQVRHPERSELLLHLLLKQVALDAVLNSHHESNNHRETSGESGAADDSKMEDVERNKTRYCEEGHPLRAAIQRTS